MSEPRTEDALNAEGLRNHAACAADDAPSAEAALGRLLTGLRTEGGADQAADILGEYLVSAARRAALLQAAADLPDRIRLDEALDMIAGHQTDVIGEAPCRFLADAARRHRWGFIPGAGFVEEAPRDGAR